MEFPKSAYAFGAHEDISGLVSPPTDFWPAYSWVWNDQITENGILEQLSTFHRRGIRVFYIIPEPKEFRPKTMPTQLVPDYLSDEYLRLVRFAATEAAKLGIRAWLYDEGGWPSGSANGLVVAKNPSLACVALAPDGTVVDVPPFAQSYPDLLNPASTDAFLELTHDAHARAFGDAFASLLPIAFTDEPHVRADKGTIPWTNGFDKRFQERFGYDIMTRLPALFDDDLPGEDNRRARADYRDLLGEMFAENYFLPIRDWCHAHGILSAGHVGGDDVAFGNAKYGYHHILRCLRALDIPGVDAIWRQIFPAPETPGRELYAPRCANRLFPRYASSAAHQISSRFSLTESYAIYGSGLTYDQMRWVFAFQAVRGINLLNLMSMSYSYRGPMAASCGRPTFSPLLPGAEDIALFNEWAARVCYLNSSGKPVADAALYMPLQDIWPADDAARMMAERFEQTGAALEAVGADFDVIDDDCILAAALDHGTLRIGDAAYRTIYLPDGVTLPPKVQEKLRSFGSAGGTVTICSGDYPVHSAIRSDCAALRVARRYLDEGRVYLLTSESFAPTETTVRFPDEGDCLAYELDLTTGERRAVSVAPYELSLPLGGMTALLFTRDGQIAEPAARHATLTRHIDLGTPFFRRLRGVTLTPDGIDSAGIEEPYQRVPLGDWRDTAGAYFSGDAEYLFEFDAPADEDADYTLDLGDVRFSCEVTLNDTPVGKAVFTPFTFRLPKLQPRNILTVRVSNTMANAYAGCDFTQWHPAWTLGPYHAIERDFERESLASGLFGPVRILW
ncbi:MAG: glycosyl hydrolase [Clostridiaceae bacterium]|nr:glycosyl hydrolase [Clostridiaceae bacterium]